MLFENLLDMILGFLAAYYALVVLSLIVGIRRLKHSSFQGKPFVSVIVAARNEEIHIKDLLDCLVRQDYPEYEIIVVNDRSSDDTPAIIDKYQRQHATVHRIDITWPSRDMPSKKYALAQGIAGSKGDILMFTDADCLPPSSWIASLVQGFEKNVGLVAGYSPYILQHHSRAFKQSLFSSIFRSFIQYEEFKGATWSAGSIGLNRGWLCTGRSLAYRRSVYDEVGGFERIKHSVSGDDDLFLQLVRRTTLWQIRYVTSPASYVPTYFPDSFREFVQQRTRHFSAAKYFSFLMKLFFFLYHMANLFIFLSLVSALVGGPSSITFWPYLIKFVMDCMLFLTASTEFDETRFALLFLPMEIAIILYNCLIGPLGFIRKFEWKPDTKS